MDEEDGLMLNIASSNEGQGVQIRDRGKRKKVNRLLYNESFMI